MHSRTVLQAYCIFFAPSVLLGLANGQASRRLEARRGKRSLYLFTHLLSQHLSPGSLSFALVSITKSTTFLRTGFVLWYRFLQLEKLFLHLASLGLGGNGIPLFPSIRVLHGSLVSSLNHTYTFVESTLPNSFQFPLFSLISASCQELD